MDAIVDSVRPVDGTQDAEATRDATRDALADLLGQYPDADLLALTDAQRDLVVERFAANDVFNRFSLDVGRTIIERAPTIAQAMQRLTQVKAFLREEVAAAFRRLRDSGSGTSGKAIRDITHAALRDAFAVFEGYLT